MVDACSRERERSEPWGLERSRDVWRPPAEVGPVLRFLGEA
jgi:hypothetical protein